MNFEEFLLKIRPKKSDQLLPVDFVILLLASTGMKGTVSHSAATSYYYGRRDIPPAMKTDIKENFNKEKLTTFLEVFIGESNLENALCRFGIPKSSPIYGELFYEALCKQFYYLIGAEGKETKDIVSDTYTHLLEKKQAAMGAYMWLGNRQDTPADSIYSNPVEQMSMDLGSIGRTFPNTNKFVNGPKD